MKRLPKGFGSIQKLSGSRRKPYGVRIWKPETAQYKYIGYYATQQEAFQALNEYNKNPYNADLSTTTIEDIWTIFKERRFNKISTSGQYVYKAAYKHLKPIHNKHIKNLKTYHLQAIIDSMPTEQQSKRHVQALLHQMFNIAAELDIVQKNYAEFIKLESKTKSSIHTAFTQEEISALFNAVFSHPWADTVLIMIYSGMRPSELLSINTENVHIEEHYMTGGLKTEAGKSRIIPINNKVLPFIKKRYNPNQTFLIESNGKKVSYSSYRKEFDKLMKSLNMKHLPHDGRHTFASLADTAGMNKTALKKIIGHSSGDITEKIYTHKEVSELLKNVNMI